MKRIYLALAVMGLISSVLIPSAVSAAPIRCRSTISTAISAAVDPR